MATLTPRLSARPRGPLSARPVHPIAWWTWAICLAVAASRTTNPVLLAAVIGVAAWVVMARRSDAPWALAFRLYLALGALIVLIRVVFRILFGGGQGEVVLVPLPTIGVPGVSAGITLLGDVTAESLLAGFYDGLRLAAIVICLGAANSLANPRRLLRSMPPALHEISTALVVALSVFPQLAESFLRVRAANQLRPHVATGRVARMRAVLVPVLEDALERSLVLAASMDSRGYGRSGDRSRRSSVGAGALMIGGLLGICVGVYALLDVTTPRYLAGPMLVAGAVVGVVGVALSGRAVRRTTYRPDPWGAPEAVTVVAGLTTAAVMVWAGRAQPELLSPSLNPPAWPALAPLPLLGLLVSLVPAFATPEPPPVEADTR